MTGENHQQDNITNICEKCGNAINAEATLIIKGRIVCRDCIEKAVFRNEGKKVAGSRKTGICFLLSLIPGAGHVYLGLKNKGLVFLLAFFGIMVLTDFFTTVGPIIGLIWIYAFIDSLTSCASLNKGEILQDINLPAFEEVTDKIFTNKNVVGTILIGIGALGLLSTFVDSMNRILEKYFDTWHLISAKNLSLSLLFLALGFYLIIKAKKQERK
ncbi:MAG: TraR/DksA C4-type zinc finger protein [Firmicutes bacterium]|nr:TraR/DksA C4-type zinc finger protein [Bacillota bacterium]